MFDKKYLAALAALPLLVGLAGCNAAVGVAQAGAAAMAGGGSSASAPLTCEIAAHPGSGGIVLEGVVHADAAVTGTYELQVTGGGGGNSSTISQGGGFSAGPGGATTLSRVMLSTGRYQADLTVTVNGTTTSCSERIGG